MKPFILFLLEITGSCTLSFRNKEKPGIHKVAFEEILTSDIIQLSNVKLNTLGKG